MMYSFAPRSDVITDIPGVPFGRVPPNYLRDNMVATLARQDVEFDLLVQVQTDPHRDADRERGGALAGEALALRPGRDGPHPPAELRHAGPRRARSSGCRSTPGTACPSTARSAIRAARAGGCIPSCPGSARTATARRTSSRRGTSCPGSGAFPSDRGSHHAVLLGGAPGSIAASSPRCARLR